MSVTDALLAAFTVAAALAIVATFVLPVARATAAARFAPAVCAAAIADASLLSADSNVVAVAPVTGLPVTPAAASFDSDSELLPTASCPAVLVALSAVCLALALSFVAAVE